MSQRTLRTLPTSRTISLLVFLAILAFIVVPTVFPHIAFGQGNPGGIVPCEGVKANNVADCNFDYLLQLATRFMNFIILVSIPLSSIVFAYAGYLFLTAAGNESQVSKAKEIFTKVLIGFIFILCAWLIVSTITTALLCDPAAGANTCGYFNLLDNRR